MPINEDSRGHNKFDPTKRIRGTLTKEFTEQVEAGALEKLAMVANSAAIRSDEKPEDGNVNGGVKVNRFNIVHTSEQKPFTPAKSIDAVTQRLYAKTGEKKINLSLIGNKGDNPVLPIINNVLSEGTSLYINKVTRDALETGKFGVSDIAKFGAGAIAEFGIDSVTRLNTVEYNKYFENLDFSEADIKVINNTALIENAKYSGLKAAKEVIVPNLIRLGLNKVLPEKVKNNVAYKIAVNDLNIPRIATSVTGSIVYKQYAKKTVEKAYKADSTIKDVAKACAVKEISSRITLSETNVEGLVNLGLRLSDIVNSATTKTKFVEKPNLNKPTTVKKTEVKTQPTAKKAEPKKTNATSSTKKVA